MAISNDEAALANIVPRLIEHYAIFCVRAHKARVAGSNREAWQATEDADQMLDTLTLVDLATVIRARLSAADAIQFLIQSGEAGADGSDSSAG